MDRPIDAIAVGPRRFEYLRSAWENERPTVTCYTRSCSLSTFRDWVAFSVFLMRIREEVYVEGVELSAKPRPMQKPKREGSRESGGDAWLPRSRSVSPQDASPPMKRVLCASDEGQLSPDTAKMLAPVPMRPIAGFVILVEPCDVDDAVIYRRLVLINCTFH
ncbi:hypothetical protein AURDEDRAFT_182195, partial [Auricularia subglabra TFB-10046 SS5]